MDGKKTIRDVLGNNPRMNRLILWSRQHNEKMAGDDGEELARRTFKSLGLTYEQIDQTPETFDPNLKAAGGKRADFKLESGEKNKIVYVDAKHASTDGMKVYRISVVEMQKYLALEEHERALNPNHKVEVYLLVYPKEAMGECFAFLEIDAFADAVAGKIHDRTSHTDIPAIELKLDGYLKHSLTGEPWDGKLWK